MEYPSKEFKDCGKISFESHNNLILSMHDQLVPTVGLLLISYTSTIREFSKMVSTRSRVVGAKDVGQKARDANQI